MPNHVEFLLSAQSQLLAPATADSAHREAVLKRLQASVPAPVLAHFLRLLAQGRKGVGLVRNGVCSACHLRLPSGIAAVLLKSDDLHLCEHCGAYLALAPEEAARLTAHPAPIAIAVRRGRKPRAVAVATAAG